MRSNAIPATLTAFLLTLLVACGGGDDKTTTPTETEPPAVAEATPEPEPEPEPEAAACCDLAAILAMKAENKTDEEILAALASAENKFELAEGDEAKLNEAGISMAIMAAIKGEPMPEAEGDAAAGGGDAVQRPEREGRERLQVSAVYDKAGGKVVLTNDSDEVYKKLNVTVNGKYMKDLTAPVGPGKSVDITFNTLKAKDGGSPPKSMGLERISVRSGDLSWSKRFAGDAAAAPTGKETPTLKDRGRGAASETTPKTKPN